MLRQRRTECEYPRGVQRRQRNHQPSPPPVVKHPHLLAPPLVPLPKSTDEQMIQIHHLGKLMCKLFPGPFQRNFKDTVGRIQLSPLKLLPVLGSPENGGGTQLPRVNPMQSVNSEHPDGYYRSCVHVLWISLCYVLSD